MTAEALTSSFASPRFFSPVQSDVDLEAAHLGAKMLGLPLFEQGINVASLLESRDGEGGALYKTAVAQIPRRATKTTSIWSVVIGRAMTRPGFKCVVTAQSGNVASAIVREYGELLEENGYAGYKRVRDDDADGDGTMRLLRNSGREKIEFSNRSRIWCVPPKAGAVRSAAADMIVIDEAGEFEGEDGINFLQGVLPLMDTRGELAQTVVAGTPAADRGGMFWDVLEEGRAGEDPDTGVIDYSMEDGEDPEDREVWRRVHPGPSSIKPDGSPLTSMRTLERRRKALGAKRFAVEYLGWWPASADTRAVPADLWDPAAADPTPLPPSRFGLAYDVDYVGTKAALVAAWRDAEGLAHIQLLEHADQRTVGREALRISRKYKVPIAYDDVGQSRALAEGLDKARPKPKLMPFVYRDAVTAVSGLMEALREGELRHPNQAALNDAAEGAAWRNAGDSGQLFGRRKSAGDVSPIVAASLALLAFDRLPVRTPLAVASAG
jgi:hypothetical protein